MAIAIVGRGCVLPGALSPAALETLIFEGRSGITEQEARWNVNPATLLGHGPDRSPTTAGGYVEDFVQQWNPDGFLVDAAELQGLDPLVHWLMYCGREALHEAGVAVGDARLQRCGLIVGNLSFPTEGMNAWGEALLLARSGRPGFPADPRNHFMSGLPAELTASALGLGAEVLALDAACASALYAIGLAWDALMAGRVDYVLAGAVNRADPLFLHMGFHALGALSPTGQSRPFHAEADGLLPAEGCVLFLLKRLEDAERDGDTILGIVRGVGLCNDGRARGLLAPAVEGQSRALTAALAQAGLPPEAISYVECHATGTRTGDVTELHTLSKVYGERALPIGSLKSNLGHLITVAGAAGILKVLGGFARRQFPPMLPIENPIPELGAFQAIQAPCPWEGPLRAGISAFGFGGNDAHLILEAPDQGPIPASPSVPAGRLAVVGLAMAAGDAPNWEALSQVLTGQRAFKRRCTQYPIDVNGLRFPPKDLQQSLAQQGWILQLGREAMAGLSVPRERQGVLTGMACDGGVTAWGLRWRMSQYRPEELDTLRDASAPILRAEQVLGTMPNIPANRLSVQLDAAGPGFSVSAEQASGLAALQIAQDRLYSGALDAVLVAAVDCGSDPRLQGALAQMGQSGGGLDAAVALVVCRAEDPIGPVLGWIDLHANEGQPWQAPAVLQGAHAADGLFSVGLGLLALQSGQAHGQLLLENLSLGGQFHRLSVQAAAPLPSPLPLPTVWLPAHPLCENLPSLKSNWMAPPPPIDVVSESVAQDEFLVQDEFFVQDDTPDLLDAYTMPLPSDPLLALIQDQQNLLAQAHQRYLQQAVAAQNAFLGAWSTQTHLMANAAQGHVAQPDVAPILEALAPAIRESDTSSVSRHLPALSPTPVPALASALAPTAAAPQPQRAPVAPPTPVVVAPVAAPPRATVAPVAAPAPKKGKWDPAPLRDLASLPGPRLSRMDLEKLSSEPIETVLGPQFAPITPYAKVVRMPEPPLLLADRVLGIEGPALVQGRGSIWTQTDVAADAWYLEDGHMPPGVLIESGQADLLLVSWQGIDLHCRSERVYRLLGCELMYRRALPKPGETLSYEIQVDGHAKLGGIRMFFFHYDCRVGDALQIQVREGQAGFFTEAELAESGGILWTPAEHTVDPKLPLQSGPVVTTARAFDRDALNAAAEGRMRDAFGPAFWRAQTHTHPPRMGHTRLLDRVTDFQPEGGPWGRGYLRAELDIDPDLWFFRGHFNNDPCMPGTLMFDGCIQAMQLYMLALGFGLTRDGWRFEPSKDQPFALICRGQVIPSSKRLTYELFIEAIWSEPTPKLRAQVLCTVDGLKCFHANPLEIEMVPDWPLSRMPGALVDWKEPKPATWDYYSLLACAWGRPSDSFGPMYKPFDGHRLCARLPGPPYHFLSRVVSTTGEMGSFKQGCSCEVEYDAPVGEWYFEAGYGVMPFAVLLEAALQPCGWLASWVGSALQSEGDMLFRNLDGKGVIHQEVHPGETVRTHVVLKNLSKSGGMIILTFGVALRRVEADDSLTPIFEFDTVFGFFPPASFAAQVGMPPSPAEKAVLEAPDNYHLDLRNQTIQSENLRYAPGNFRMLDVVNGYWPDQGPAGLGHWRATRNVTSTDWYFKAHFYTDPVQAGSLGLEAMLQLLQVHMIQRGYGKGMKNPRFEPVASGMPVEWRYRGQVVPTDRRIVVELDITKETPDMAMGDAWLWVETKDGIFRRIYKSTAIAVRVVDVDPYVPPNPPSTTIGGRLLPLGPDGALSAATRQALEGAAPPAPVGIRTMTVPVPTDHCPTWVLPALPMMTMAMMALSHAETPGLRNAAALRWLSFPEGPRTVQSHYNNGRIALKIGADTFFTAIADANPELPALPDLQDAQEIDQPGDALYAEGRLFHGPRFAVLDRIVRQGSNGATSYLRPCAPDVLLDGATHGVPHDDLQRWFPEIPAGMVGYPLRLTSLALVSAPPAGLLRCEVRALGASATGLPCLGAWLLDGDRLVAYVRWEEALLPKGRIGNAPPLARRAFLLGEAIPGVSLSVLEGDTAHLSAAEVAGSDWLPGTITKVFGSRDAHVIAAKELEGARLGLHPRLLTVEGGAIWNPHFPLQRRYFEVQGDTVIGGAIASPDWQWVQQWWRRELGQSQPWPGERLAEALMSHLLGSVEVVDPSGFAALRGRPVLYLANHETYLESVLFTITMAALSDIQVAALAKVEHQSLWLGQLHDAITQWPGVPHPGAIVYFDQADPASLPRILSSQLHARSLLVHVEGTRQVQPGAAIEKISSMWVDLCMDRQIPIVPVAFRGGIVDAKTDVPVGGARQSVHIGPAILPETLAALPYAERRRWIAQQIDCLGQPATAAQPQALLVERMAQSAAKGPVLALLQAVCADTSLITEAERALLPTWGQGLLD